LYCYLLLCCGQPTSYGQLIPILNFARLRFRNQILSDTVAETAECHAPTRKHADAKANRSVCRMLHASGVLSFSMWATARNMPRNLRSVCSPNHPVRHAVGPLEMLCGDINWDEALQIGPVNGFKLTMAMLCDRLTQLVHGSRGSGIEEAKFVEKLMSPILCFGGSQMSARDSWAKCSGFWLGCCRCRSIFLGP
jgi:hypothetical protein